MQESRISIQCLRTGTQTGGRADLSALRSWSTDAGFSVAERTTMLSPHPSAEIVDGCRVPEEDMIGAEGMASRDAHT